MRFLVEQRAMKKFLVVVFFCLPAGKRRTRVGVCNLGSTACGASVCGPGNADPAKGNAEFFPDGKWKANFLWNLGYGDRSKAVPAQSTTGV
jgi:hypothetical protein